MTRAQFEKSVITEIRAMMQRNSQQGEAVQVCSAGEWPEDHGGNWTPDRREANIAFSEWLDQQGDSMPLPESFSDWINQNQDSIIE